MIVDIKRGIKRILNFLDVYETSRIKSSEDDEFKFFTVYGFYKSEDFAIDIYEYFDGTISVNITPIEDFSGETVVFDYADYHDFTANIAKDFTNIF